MTMLKVIEVLAESPKSFDDAAKVAVANASKSVRNIRSIYIKEMNASVSGGEISRYRVNAKVTFELENGEGGG